MYSFFALSTLLLAAVFLMEGVETGPRDFDDPMNNSSPPPPIVCTMTVSDSSDPSNCSDEEQFKGFFQRLVNESRITYTSSYIYLEFLSPATVYAAALICEGCDEVYQVEVEFILQDNKTDKLNVTLEIDDDNEDNNCTKRPNSTLSSSLFSSPSYSSSSPSSSPFPSSVYRFQVLPAVRNVTAVNISLPSSIPLNATIRNLSLFDLAENVKQLTYDKDNGSQCNTTSNPSVIPSLCQPWQYTSDNSTCVVYTLPKMSNVKEVAVRIGVSFCKNDINLGPGLLPLQVLSYSNNRLILEVRLSKIKNSRVVFKRWRTGLDEDTFLEIRDDKALRRPFYVEDIEVYIWTDNEVTSNLRSSTTQMTSVNTSSINTTISVAGTSPVSSSTTPKTTSVKVISTTSTKLSPSTTWSDSSTVASTSTTDKSVSKSGNTTSDTTDSGRDPSSSSITSTSSSPSSSVSSLPSSSAAAATTTTTTTTSTTSAKTTTCMLETVSSASTTTTSTTTESSSSSSSPSTTTTTTISTTKTTSKLLRTPTISSTSSSPPSSASTTQKSTTTTTTSNTTNDLSTTMGQTVPATVTVKIDPIRLKDVAFDDSLRNDDSPSYNNLRKTVGHQLEEICKEMFPDDFVKVLGMWFSPGSVIVDSALEFSRNLTSDEIEALNNKIQNSFSSTTDIVAIVVGSVIGFLFIFVCILVVIFVVRWRRSKHQRRLQPEPAYPEPEVSGGAFPVRRPQGLLWQSSVATSSLSRRGGQSSVIELSIHGLEGGESYVGADEGSGMDKHLADTVRAKNGVKDPALRHYGDAGPGAGRLNNAKGIVAGQMWNGAIPRPELDTTRLDELRENGESVFSNKKAVANGYEVKCSQGQRMPDEVGVRKNREREELGGYDVGRRAGAEGGVGGRLGGGLGGALGGLGGAGVIEGIGAGVPLSGGGVEVVDVNIWDVSDSGTSGSDREVQNHTSNPLFPNDHPIFSGLSPVLQTNRSPTPFERSLPKPVSAGAERAEQRVPNAFEGLFVPTTTFQRHSDSSGGSSSRHLLPPIDAGITGSEGGVHQPGWTSGAVGQMEASFDDSALSEVLTLHKMQNGILSRLQGRAKPDNIHRTPTRNQMKKGAQLVLANGVENGMHL